MDAARWTLPAVAVGSFIVLLLLSSALPSSLQGQPSTDYQFYYTPIAHNLLAGQGYKPGERSADITANPPGYALLLTWLFWIADKTHVSSDTVVYLFSILCATIAGLFLFALARHFWGISGALIVLVVWLTYPFLLGALHSSLTELPFIVFVDAALSILVIALAKRNSAWPAYAGAGVLLGGAMLIRSAGIGLSVVALILIWLLGKGFPFRRRFFLSACILIAEFLIVLPWTLWAYQATHQFVISGTNAPPSIRDGLTFGVDSKGYRVDIALPEDVIALMQDFETQLGAMNSMGEIGKVVVAEFRNKPIAFLKFIGVKAIRSWYGTDSGLYDHIILLVQMLYLGAVVGAAWFIAKRQLFARPLLYAAGLTAFYFWCLALLFLPILRYVMPAMGLLFTLLPALLITDRSNVQP